MEMSDEEKMLRLGRLKTKASSPVVAMTPAGAESCRVVLANGRTFFEHYPQGWKESEPVPGTEAGSIFYRPVDPVEEEERKIVAEVLAAFRSTTLCWAPELRQSRDHIEKLGETIAHAVVKVYHHTEV